MLVSKRVLLFLLTLTVGAVGLVGCTSPTTGSPTSIDNQPSSSAEPSSASTGTDQTLAAVQPCSLVTTAEGAQLNAEGPGQVQDTAAAGSTSACAWHAHTPSDYSVTFGIDIRASQGIDELRANGGQITDGKVGSRTARQLATGNSCILTLKVGEKSRVDITVVEVGATEPTESCQIASSLGDIVEPKLPPEAN